MGLSSERMEGLRIASLLHDVGKTSIPTEILSKPSQLSALEMDLVRKHPEIGFDILSQVEFPWPVAEIVRQHHEKINGSGYPRGLKGHEMLPEARILVVADVVEAMSSHRPYRQALGINEAIDEIVTNSGILYDDRVVKTCVNLIKERPDLLS
jgi:putative nucleotidyltransferase with HDIG domain